MKRSEKGRPQDKRDRRRIILWRLSMRFSREATVYIKGETMLCPGILHNVIFLLWFFTATAIAQPQTSRASSAASYFERGNERLAKGEWDWAIADYDLAIAFDARATIYVKRGITK